MTFIKETYYNVEIENLYYTVSAIVPIEDSGLTITSSYVVLTPGTAITLNSTTSIYDGFQDGQSVTLRGTSDNNTVTINDGSNTKMNGDIVLKANDTISFVYNSVLWVETSRNNATQSGSEGGVGHLIVDILDNTYSDNTAISSGSNNVLIGYQASNNATASNIVSIGNNAGVSNIANAGVVNIGAESGGNNSFSVAVGYYTLKNITGSTNTSVGHYTMWNNTSGIGSGNTALGYGAAYNTTNGNRNLFLGARSGGFTSGAISGNDNVVSGYEAGYSLTSGTGNVLLGYRSGADVSTQSNLLYIANSDTSSPLIYGEFDNEILKFNAETQSQNLGPITDDTYNLFSTENTNVPSNLEITPTINEFIQVENSIPEAGQTFLTSTDTTLTKFSIYISQGTSWNSSENGVLYGAIYNISGGIPTGSAIYSSTNSLNSSGLTSSAVSYDFNFDNVSLTGSTTYAVIVSGDSSTTFNSVIHGSVEAPYPDGTMVINAPWIADSDYDMSFTLYFNTLTTTYNRFKTLNLSKHLKIGTLDGTAADGMIRYTGTDFEGYDNSTWKSLTSGLSVSNYGNNRVLTSDGTSTGIVAETNLLFDGSSMYLKGNIRFEDAHRTIFIEEPDEEDGFNLTIKSSNSGGSGTTPYGGHLYLNTGDGVYRSGNIYLSAGDSGTGVGGYVYIAPGDSTSSTQGKIYLGHNGSQAQGTELWSYIPTILSSSIATRAKGINPYGHNAYNLGSGTGIVTTIAESSFIIMSEGGYETLSQIFTVKKGFTLIEATLKLKQNDPVGTWNGDVVAKLYSVTGGSNGEPNALIATSTNTIPVTGLEGFPEDADFDFNSVVLSSDTYYAMVLETQSSTSFSVSWYGAIDVYSGGIGLKNDGSWSSVTTDFSMYLNSVNFKNWKDLFISGDVDFGGQVISSINMTTTTGALKVSNLTTTQESGLGALNGMITYNTTTNKFRGYVNGVWSDFTTSGDTAPLEGTLWTYTSNTTSIFFNDTVSINKVTNPTATLDVNGTLATNGNITIGSVQIQGGGGERIISVSANQQSDDGCALNIYAGGAETTAGHLKLSGGYGAGSGTGGRVYIYGGDSNSGTEGEIYLGWNGTTAIGTNTYVKNNLILGHNANGNISVGTVGSETGYNLTVTAGVASTSGDGGNLFLGGGAVSPGGGENETGGDVYIYGGNADTNGRVYIGWNGSTVKGFYTHIKNDNIELGDADGDNVTISVADSTDENGHKLTIQAGAAGGGNSAGNLELFGGTDTLGGEVYVCGGAGTSQGDVILGQVGAGGAIVGETKVKNDAIFSGNLKILGQGYSSINTVSVSSGVVDTDCDLGNVHKLSLTESAILNSPSNSKEGGTYLWIITNTSDYILTFGSNFYWPDGSNNVISGINGTPTVSIITGVCVSNGGLLYCNMIVNMTDTP